MPATRSTRAKWAERIERWRRSGLSLREYAEREGLALKSLSWWRWHLHRSTGTSPSTALMPLAPAFVEIEAAPVEMMTPFEVVLSNGRVVRVPTMFNDAALSRVLAAADGQA